MRFSCRKGTMPESALLTLNPSRVLKTLGAGSAAKVAAAGAAAAAAVLA